MDEEKMIAASKIMEELEETMLCWLDPGAPHDRFAAGAAYGCARVAKNLNLIGQLEYERISNVLIYGSVENVRNISPYQFRECFENEAGITAEQHKSRIVLRASDKRKDL